MTPEQMRDRSASKVKQIMDMMRILSVRVEARERITESGFIEKIVYWIDDEAYVPPPEETGPTGGTAEEAAGPTGATA